MARIDGEVLIRRPVEEVFDFVADERTEPIFNHNMLSSEKVTDGPIGVGTRFRAVIRAGRKALPMDIEYTGFDRPHLIASNTHMSTADFSGTLTFTPTLSGTRLRWSWRTRPRGVVRLAAPVLARVGARQERQMWTQLRDHLEAESHARDDAGRRYGIEAVRGIDRPGDIPDDTPGKAPAGSVAGPPPRAEESHGEAVASGVDSGNGSAVGPAHLSRVEQHGKAASTVETGLHSSGRTFIKRHVVTVFYVLVFALALGLALVVSAFVGATGSVDTDAEMAGAADLPLVMYAVAVLAGPGSYALAAVLATALAYGSAGLRDLGSRLFRWRVGARWYAVALLTVPVLMMTTLLALSLTSDAFIPAILTAEDRASLLVTGLVAGLMAGFLEEIAWTGFATHELSKRHRVLGTGLLVAVPWFVLHLPLWVPADSGTVPRALSVAVIVPWFLSYRVLMVWVYTHTQSVLLAMLMHMPITASAFILASPAIVGVPDLVYNLVLGAEMCILVALVAAADRRMPARSGLDRSALQLRHDRRAQGSPEP